MAVSQFFPATTGHMWYLIMQQVCPFWYKIHKFFELSKIQQKNLPFYHILTKINHVVDFKLEALILQCLNGLWPSRNWIMTTVSCCIRSNTSGAVYTWLDHWEIIPHSVLWSGISDYLDIMSTLVQNFGPRSYTIHTLVCFFGTNIPVNSRLVSCAWSLVSFLRSHNIHAHAYSCSIVNCHRRTLGVGRS